MTFQEIAGWVAAALTLLTFSMQSMLALRLVAITANFAFITYGMLAALAPVLFLHLLLLPCNIVRLAQLLAGRRGAIGGASRRRGASGQRGASACTHGRGAAFEPQGAMHRGAWRKRLPATRPRPAAVNASAPDAGEGAAARPRTGASATEPSAVASLSADADSEAVLHVVQGRVCVRWGEWRECVARAEPGELVALPRRVPKPEIGASRAEAPAFSESTGGQPSR